MTSPLTSLCLDLESGLAELVNSQDDWRLCALLSAARQGVAGVRRRAQDEAAGEDACRVADAALAGAPPGPWGPCETAECVVCGSCPECSSPCPPGLAMCVECQAREGRE